MRWLLLKMKWPVFKLFVPLALALIVALLALRGVLVTHTSQVQAQRVSSVAASASHKAKQAAAASSRKSAAAKASAAKASAAEPIDWRAPSQDKPYPDVTQHPKLTFDVDLAKQRVYLKDQGKLLYTMYASSGMDDTTPRGHYQIQVERGTHFFNGHEMMGANYYTSWLNHGEYLFHSVPTDARGNYLPKEAANLGKRPSSHGCVRLTIPDAKWIFEHAKVGMAVNVY
ncbi:L,D-transpeptidase [Lacticaseibacillus jixiensis]|uniref:L,D-transpeptidase n=1 Tax=Lacticaseibacillus jixiensis TaxID=3231926 RepID=UPI0036F254E6